MRHGAKERASWSWRAAVVVVGSMFLLIAAPSPVHPADSKGFPTTEEERDKWFPPSEEDADPLSDPDPPKDLDLPGSPRTMKDKASDWFDQTRPQDGRTLDERLEDTTKRDADTLEMVAKALKQPMEPAPPPPDYELECNDDPAIGITTEQLVQAYVRKAVEPEFGLLRRLLDNRRELQLLGETTPETYQTQLADRLLAKARGLIASHGKDRDKVLAILGFVHRAQNVAALVGGEAKQSFYAEITRWLQGLMPDLLRDLRERHDYRAVSAILALGQAIIYSGDGAGVNPEAIMSEIERAMSFDLSMKVHVRSTGANGSVEEWWLDGRIPLKARLSKGRDDATPKILLEGEGSGRYERYLEHDGDLTMTAPGFEIVARIKEFDACKGSGTLAFDRFYADTETYHYPDGPPTDLPMMESAFVVFYGDKRSTDGYEVEVPVVDRKEKAVDTVITDAVGVFDLDLTVELTHRPN